MSVMLVMISAPALTAGLINFDGPRFKPSRVIWLFGCLAAHKNPEITDPLFFFLTSPVSSKFVYPRVCVHIFAQACVSEALIKIVWELMPYSCSTAPVSSTVLHILPGNQAVRTQQPCLRRCQRAGV